MGSSAPCYNSSRYKKLQSKTKEPCNQFSEAEWSDFSFLASGWQSLMLLASESVLLLWCLGRGLFVLPRSGDADWAERLFQFWWRSLMMTVAEVSEESLLFEADSGLGVSVVTDSPSSSVEEFPWSSALFSSWSSILMSSVSAGTVSAWETPEPIFTAELRDRWSLASGLAWAILSSATLFLESEMVFSSTALFSSVFTVLDAFANLTLSARFSDLPDFADASPFPGSSSSSTTVVNGYGFHSVSFLTRDRRFMSGCVNSGMATPSSWHSLSMTVST